MSIRWVKNIVIDGVKSMIEIQIGDRRIGDKCYARVNAETEEWFETTFDNREAIIKQGKDLLKERLKGRKITYPDGKAFDWS
jgi:hypothetical protein